MINLKPCPFCGGNDIVYEEALSVTYCNDCGGELDEGFGSDWNTRPIEDALQSRIAELEKDLSNKEIEYTDLWDDALALQARIAELEANNAELKERVAMLDVTAVYKSLGEMGYIEQVANLKAENAAFQSRIAELEGIIKSDDERLTEAGLKVNLYFGCDTAEIMAEEILSSRARIAELEAAQRWIPVSERLPEANKCVLIYDAGGNMTVDILVKSGGVETYFWLPKYRILFWMPLPEPPEVQE